MVYDLIIIGAGPAGLTASIYASRYKIKHLVIGAQLGGAMSMAAKIENYPGFESISGLELAKKMETQTKNLGAEVVYDSTTAVKKEKDGFQIVTDSGKNYLARTMILATGTQRRKLEVPGEEEYQGKGVSYCSTCDAAFFKDKNIIVVGGANAAVMGAIHLAEFAKKIYLVYRKKPLRAEPLWVERIEKHPKIEIVYETNIKEIKGDGKRVTEVALDRSYKGKDSLVADGVFVEIGGAPGTELAKPLGVKIDKNNYIVVDNDMATNVPGVFAAGDIANVSGEFQQIVMAVAEGARAVLSIYKLLKQGVDMPRA